MFTEYLDEIDAINRSLGESSKRVGATEEEIQSVIDRAKRDLGYGLPEDYLAFLRITNGLNDNGRFIFCADDTANNAGDSVCGMDKHDIVAETLFWRRADEKFRSWIFFGNDNLDQYVFNGDVNVYQQHNVSGDVLNVFASFTEMAEKILSDALKG